MRSGQILILVLLMVVVILAIGLSVASRNIINLRTSTQTEQSQRAFTAAEGGIEDVLSRISAIEQAHPVEITSSTGVSITDVEPVGEGVTTAVVVKARPVFELFTSLGNVSQIKLEGATGSQVQIEWAKKGSDSIEISPRDGTASIEAIYLYGSSPSISQTRWFFPGNPGSESRSESIAVVTPGSVSCTSVDFNHCMKINLLANPRILRIKPFWVATTVKVSGVGFNLPTQTYDVSSTASTDIGVTRKVEVKRTALPQLPSIFDYALYSETDIIK